MSKTHDLKTWTSQYDAVLMGIKRFEYRKDDRGFEAGDTLRLREWLPSEGRYVGPSLMVKVLYIARGPRFGIPYGYCVMSIELESKS